MPAPAPVQPDVVTDPLLSHPQDTEEVMVNPL
jgi:hypothetical protein